MVGIDWSIIAQLALAHAQGRRFQSSSSAIEDRIVSRRRGCAADHLIRSVVLR
jgi:DNA-binding transcriptional regulator of glucitol operon